MPANLFMKDNKIGANNIKKSIFFVISSQPRYLIKFPYLPKLFQEYMDCQKRFIGGLCDEPRSNVCIRPHRDDYGWSIINRLKDYVAPIKVSSWDTSFNAELNKCRIFVCDHLSTTYLQALVENVPTILFWSPGSNVLKDEAQPYFDLLRDSGILFDSPEDASAAINRIYNDVQAWWCSDAVVDVVATFKRQYCDDPGSVLKEVQRVLMDAAGEVAR